MIQIPTGGGKTKLAAEIVSKARGKKKRVIFEVPAISLVDQTFEAFHAEGLGDEVGVIQASHYRTDWGKPIQIASVQTLMKQGVPQADIVIRDEAHKNFTFDNRWMVEEAWRNVPFIGMTATPWTKGLGKLYERLIVATTMRELMDKGILCRFKVFAPSHPDLSGVRSVGGDYHQGELSAAMQKEKLFADIVNTWLARAERRPTICFAVDRNHAQSLRERFEAAGVSAAYMDCNTPLAERADIKRQFLARAVQVVCNVDVIGIGVDWPEIACISYCRPTRSEMRFVQNIGRGLRAHASKDYLLVLDHSDTHLRLGYVSDIHHSTMNGGKLPPGGPVPTRVRLPKECPQCGYLKPFGVQECSHCGFKTKAPPPVREFTRAELAEFDGKKKRGVTEKFSQADKAIFLAELKAYAASHGYKPGWAAQKYKTRFECWPAHSIENVAPRPIISAATLNWIRSQNMKWAYGQAKEAKQAQALVAGTLCTPEDLEEFK